MSSRSASAEGLPDALLTVALLILMLGLGYLLCGVP